MPRPYSNDLRIRILKALDAEIPLQKISDTFEISIKTIYLWRKQLENFGCLQTRTGYQKGHNPKIPDLNSFEEFIKKNNSLTLIKLAEKMGNISTRTVHRAIKKLGYSNENQIWVKNQKKSSLFFANRGHKKVVND